MAGVLSSPPRPPDEAHPVIQGSLHDAPISDVFQIIVSGLKSGVLTVVKKESRARLYFEGGRLQYAHLSPGPHLGEILVRLDLLSAFEVQMMLLKQSSVELGASGKSVPLGLLAVREGLMDEGDLKRALRAQVLEVMTELITWKSGAFSFVERSPEVAQHLNEHALDAVQLLMETAQRLHEWESAVPARAVFEKSGDPTKVSLLKGSWEVLGYVDSKRSARSIAAELDVPEKQVYRILAELEAKGVIQALSFAPETPLVLFVSPSSALQRLVRLTLQRARLEVLLADDPAGGLDALAAARPQAVVVDDAGDGGAGAAWTFVKELRKRSGGGHLPVLVLTGVKGSLLERLRRPKALTLEKPFHEIDLQQSVVKMVGQPLA